MKNWIAKYRANDLARNTAWMLLGQGLSLFIQALYFVIIARSLGAQQYGTFIAATAFPQILSPFVRFRRRQSSNQERRSGQEAFCGVLGQPAVHDSASGLASIAFVIAVARLVLPASIPLLVIVCVSLADLIFFRLIDCAAMAFQAVSAWTLPHSSESGLRWRDSLASLCWPPSSTIRPPGIGHSCTCHHHVWGNTGTGLGAYQDRQRRVWRLAASEGSLSRGCISRLVCLRRTSTTISTRRCWRAWRPSMLSAFTRQLIVSSMLRSFPVRSLLYAGYTDFFRAGNDGMTRGTQLHATPAPEGGWLLDSWLSFASSSAPRSFRPF